MKELAFIRKKVKTTNYKAKLYTRQSSLEEVSEVIVIPEANKGGFEDPRAMDMGAEVRSELTAYVTAVADMYNVSQRRKNFRFITILLYLTFSLVKLDQNQRTIHSTTLSMPATLPWLPISS